MINSGMIPGAPILGIGLACGLNLYASVALIGLASRYNWITDVPIGLRGLENGLIIGSAVTLFMAELVVRRMRLLAAVWEGVHTLIRPAAAGLLSMLALQGEPWQVQSGIAVGAAALAFAAHGSMAGVRVILAVRGRGGAGAGSARANWISPSLIVLLEDLAAIAIVAAVMLLPDSAMLIVGAAVALLLLAGPRPWRAARLGLRALLARLRGFFGHADWRTCDQLPRGLRHLIPPEPLGHAPPRVIRATVLGLPSAGAYRNGWLVLTGGGPRFIYRSVFRARSTGIPLVHHVRLRPGLMTDALELTTNGARGQIAFTVFLFKDGPPAPVAAAELTPERAT